MSNDHDRWSVNYSRSERKVLNKYKKEYLQCETASDRKRVVGQVIFPALCATWRMESGDSVIPFVPEKIKKLVQWIRNNWRLTNSRTGEKGLKISSRNVVWQMFHERVTLEVERLMEEAEAEGGDSSWIANCSRALSNVRKQLTAEEKEKVKCEVECQEKSGLTLEGKRKLRRRYCKSRLDEAALKNFMEMDVLSFTFIVQRNRDGEVEIQFHDKVANLLGLPESFNMSSQQTVQVRQFKNAIADYFIDLKTELTKYASLTGRKSTTPTGTQTELMDGLPNTTELHPAGLIPEPYELWYIGPKQYPFLKADCNLSKITKTVLEATMRKYLGQHYLLATGNIRKHVPWDRIVGNESVFFPKNVLPSNIRLKAPRDMSKDDIEEYKSGKDVFRFLMITTGHSKNSAVIPSKYNDEEPNLEKEQPGSKATKKRRRAVPNTGRVRFQGAITPSANPSQAPLGRDTIAQTLPNDPPEADLNDFTPPQDARSANGQGAITPSANPPQEPVGWDTIAQTLPNGPPEADLDDFTPPQDTRSANRQSAITPSANPSQTPLGRDTIAQTLPNGPPETPMGSVCQDGDGSRRPVPRKTRLNDVAMQKNVYMATIYGDGANNAFSTEWDANQATSNANAALNANAVLNISGAVGVVVGLEVPTASGTKHKRTADKQALEEAASLAPVLEKRRRKPTEKAMRRNYIPELQYQRRIGLPKKNNYAYQNQALRNFIFLRGRVEAGPGAGCGCQLGGGEDIGEVVSVGCDAGGGGVAVLGLTQTGSVTVAPALQAAAEKRAKAMEGHVN
ncbi:hypothetical protein CPC08DRAFT_730868 [Agrocybe pediades]|nr:hypothetical protein CPC08DRAFT_730868 [Agrocybe pediades]